MKNTLFFVLLCVCVIFSGVSAANSSGSSFFNNSVSQAEDSDVNTNTDNQESSSLSDIISSLQKQIEEKENPVSDSAVLSRDRDTSVLPSTASAPVHSNQGSFKLESVRITGMDDEGSRQFLDMLEGLKLDYFTQNGDPSRFGFTLSLGNTVILSYSLQNGDPYYAASNFFGGNTYMISDSDQFEEKLVSAMYELMENMSQGSTSELPPLDTVLAAIGAYREQKKLPQAEKTAGPDLSNLYEQIDNTALLTWFVSIADRFVPAEPEQAPGYRCAELAPYMTAYQWPDINDLPAPKQAASSISAVFTGEDLADLMDVLAQFFKDNPLLAAEINQYISMQIQDDMMKVENGDYLTPILAELREDIKNDCQDLIINFKMDLTESGEPCYAALLIADTGSAKLSGMNYSIILSQDDFQVLDIAADLFEGNEIIPIFRGLITGSADKNGKQTINVLFGPNDNNTLEYAQTINRLTSSFGAAITDSRIDFRFNDFSGSCTILSNAVPNAFDSSDTASQITMNFAADGESLGSVSAVLENNAAAPLPSLTPKDAIHASEMSPVDYSVLASTIFSQIVMLSMIFM